MLVCATLFWAGNFNIGKFAFIESISPFTLAFLRWLLVWIILMPLTYREILSLKNIIFKNLKSDWDDLGSWDSISNHSSANFMNNKRNSYSKWY